MWIEFFRIVIASRLLPEGERGAAGVPQYSELAGGPPRLRLKHLRAEPDRPLRRSVDVVDLREGNPAQDPSVSGGDRGEGAALPGEHRHARRAARGLPAEELLVEADGIAGLIAAVMEPDKGLGHKRPLFEPRRSRRSRERRPGAPRHDRGPPRRAKIVTAAFWGQGRRAVTEPAAHRPGPPGNPAR